MIDPTSAYSAGRAHTHKPNKLNEPNKLVLSNNPEVSYERRIMTSSISTECKVTGMGSGEEVLRTIQERMAAEERVKERIDEEGNRWTKVYFGGGAHFRNWLEQCRELGEVMVEEVDSTGYTCFEQGGEPLYRIWMKMGETGHADLF